MGNASGRVGGASSNNPSAGQFVHAPSNVPYRVFQDNGEWYFEFIKNLRSASGQEVRGRRRMEYFIGSGSHARGYIFAEAGFLFQVPLSYYSGIDRWDTRV
jgi:hypothetical protein